MGPVLRPRVRDALDFEQRAQRQAIRAEGAASGEFPVREIGHVDLIERRPVGHVVEHHRAFHQVAIAEALPLQHRADIVHGLLRLRVDACGQLAVRADADLARHEQDVADANRFREGQPLLAERRAPDEFDCGPLCRLCRCVRRHDRQYSCRYRFHRRPHDA